LASIIFKQMQSRMLRGQMYPFAPLLSRHLAQFLT
jgi:hypothetical protein